MHVTVSPEVETHESPEAIIREERSHGVLTAVGFTTLEAARDSPKRPAELRRGSKTAQLLVVSRWHNLYDFLLAKSHAIIVYAPYRTNASRRSPFCTPDDELVLISHL